jgi:predicted component of type VI protein secretion system
MPTISDDSLLVIAAEIEAQYSHLDDEEWRKIVNILSQRSN